MTTTTTAKPSLPKRGAAPFRPVDESKLDEIGSKAVQHAAAVQPTAPVEKVKLPKLTVNLEPDMLKRFKLRCVNDGITGQDLLHKLIAY